MFRRKEKVAVETEAFVDKWEAGLRHLPLQPASLSEGNTGSTQSDSDSETAPECQECGHQLGPGVVFCPKCGTKREDPKRGCCRCTWRCCCCCCCYSLISTAILIGLGVLLALTMNTWVRVGLEEVGDAVFGTDVKIGAINLGLQRGRATITNATVSSPPGYDGSFFTLGRLVFDLSPKSLLAAWLSNWDEPINLQEFTIRNISVLIDMKWAETPDVQTVSNAQTIVTHLNKAVEPLPTPAPEVVEQVGLHALAAKIKVGRVELSDIDAGVLLHPFLSHPVDWDIKEVIVSDVGKDSNGVYVWEFLEILTRAVLMAVVKGAPDNIRGNLAKVFGKELVRNMDISKIEFNTGKGLEKIGEFTGWATTEAALLPLKFTALQAKITGKAIATQMRMGLKAAEVGAKLTGMGIRANLAATGAGIKAGMKANEMFMKAGLKANEEAMKIRNAFTMGVFHAMR